MSLSLTTITCFTCMFLSHSICQNQSQAFEYVMTYIIFALMVARKLPCGGCNWKGMLDNLEYSGTEWNGTGSRYHMNPNGTFV